MWEDWLSGSLINSSSYLSDGLLGGGLLFSDSNNTSILSCSFNINNSCPTLTTNDSNTMTHELWNNHNNSNNNTMHSCEELIHQHKQLSLSRQDSEFTTSGSSVRDENIFTSPLVTDSWFSCPVLNVQAAHQQNPSGTMNTSAQSMRENMRESIMLMVKKHDISDRDEDEEEQEYGDSVDESDHVDIKEDSSTFQPLTCMWIDCKGSFDNQTSLVSHIEKVHIEGRREDFSCFWLGCPRRNRPFNARYKLLIHMRVHTGERPNKCTFSGCTKAFSRLENLKIHIRSHTGERPYICIHASCSKAFSNSSDRAKHQRTHFDQKPYACLYQNCGKKYTDPSSLRKHAKMHYSGMTTPQYSTLHHSTHQQQRSNSSSSLPLITTSLKLNSISSSFSCSSSTSSSSSSSSSPPSTPHSPMEISSRINRISAFPDSNNMNDGQSDIFTFPIMSSPENNQPIPSPAFLESSHTNMSKLTYHSNDNDKVDAFDWMTTVDLDEIEQILF